MSIEGDELSYDGNAGGDAVYEPAGQAAYTPTYLSSSGAKDQASRNQARIARADYADWKARFVPVRDELISQIGDPSVYREAVARSTDAVDSGYATGAGEMNRNMERYGVQASAVESDQMQRQYGLSKSLATVEAANRSRAAVKDRDMQIMSGGLSVSSVRKNNQGQG